jgi:hypothetical protein
MRKTGICSLRGCVPIMENMVTVSCWGLSAVLPLSCISPLTLHQLLEQSRVGQEVGGWVIKLLETRSDRTFFEESENYALLLCFLQCSMPS